MPKTMLSETHVHAENSGTEALKCISNDGLDLEKPPPEEPPPGGSSSLSYRPPLPLQISKIALGLTQRCRMFIEVCLETLQFQRLENLIQNVLANISFCRLN